MTDYKHELAVAQAALRAEGLARFRELEHEAAGMLERGGKLTSVERREYEIMRAMAGTFARVFLVETDEFIGKMSWDFAEDETDTGRMEA